VARRGMALQRGKERCELMRGHSQDGMRAWDGARAPVLRPYAGARAGWDAGAGHGAMRAAVLPPGGGVLARDWKWVGVGCDAGGRGRCV
jgi:hypothetical protein